MLASGLEADSAVPCSLYRWVLRWVWVSSLLLLLLLPVEPLGSRCWCRKQRPSLCCSITGSWGNSSTQFHSGSTDGAHAATGVWLSWQHSWFVSGWFLFFMLNTFFCSALSDVLEEEHGWNVQQLGWFRLVCGAVVNASTTGRSVVRCSVLTDLVVRCVCVCICSLFAVFGLVQKSGVGSFPCW